MQEISSSTMNRLIDSEYELIARLKAGDEAAAEELFCSFYGSLCRFAHRRISSRQDVEDIVENVFEQLWINRGNLDPAQSVKSYLFKAVLNKCIDFLRQSNRKFVAFDEENHDAISSSDPAHDTMHSELSLSVNKAIQDLPPRCREVFALSRQHGLTHTEIAEVLGISQKTVENQIGRAIKILRKTLKHFLG